MIVPSISLFISLTSSSPSFVNLFQLVSALASKIKKELKEETGISAKLWQQIGVLHTSNSATDEKAIIYLATELTFGAPQPEDTEQLIVNKIPFTTFISMIVEGKITDAISVCAGLLTEKWLLNNKFAN